MNEINARQLSIMVFFIPLVFKMSMLPSYLYKIAQADGYICATLFTILEFMQLAVILYILSFGGLKKIESLYGKKATLPVVLPLLFVIFIKSVLFIREIVNYVSTFLFYNIVTTPIVITIILVTYYLGYKGARSVSRLFETAVWLIPVLVLMGLIFGKSNINTQYVLPVFIGNGKVIAEGCNTYLIYAFDFSPLLFCDIKLKQKRGVVVCSVLSILAVTGCYIILYSRYGRASFLADCAFARLASFDTVISEIGSLDWISALLWLSVALLNLGLKCNAVAEIGTYVGLKRFCLPAVFGICLALCLLYVWQSLEQTLSVVTGGIQYIVFGIEILVPLVLWVLYMGKRNAFPTRGEK